MSDFNPNALKHRPAVSDLQTLTGLEFNLQQVSSSSGELWVYRTTTPATYVPDYDLLTLEKGVSPLNITPSDALAREAGMKMHLNLAIQSKPFAEVIRQTEDGPGAITHRFDAVETEKGSYKGALDYYAENYGDRKALNLEALREQAKAVEPRGKFASFFSKKKEPYTPPQLSDFFAKETTQADIEEIAVRKQEWQDRMKTLAKDKSDHLALSVNKGLAIEGITETDEIQTEQKALLERLKNRGKSGPDYQLQR